MYLRVGPVVRVLEGVEAVIVEGLAYSTAAHYEGKMSEVPI